MRNIKLRNAKKKEIRKLDSQLDAMMEDMRSEAVSYLSGVVFCALKTRCMQLGLENELSKTIAHISVKNPTETLTSVSVICDVLEKVELGGLATMIAVVTNGKVGFIRNFLVEFLKDSFLYRIEAEDENEFLEEDDVLDEDESASPEVVMDEFERFGCNGVCRFGMKNIDLRICKKCKYYKGDGMKKHPCADCMGACMGDCDSCKQIKECGVYE